MGRPNTEVNGIAMNELAIVAPLYFLPYYTEYSVEGVSSDGPVAYLQYLSRCSTRCTYTRYMSLVPTFFLSVSTSIPGLHIAWHLGRHI